MAVSSLVASVAYVDAHFVLKHEPLFRVADVAIASPYEYFALMVIGVAGALVATAFMRPVEFADQVAGNLAWPEPLKTSLAGLALGIVALQVPDILGIGQDALRLAIAGNAFSAMDLALILVAKKCC